MEWRFEMMIRGVYLTPSYVSQIEPLFLKALMDGSWCPLAVVKPMSPEGISSRVAVPEDEDTGIVIGAPFRFEDGDRRAEKVEGPAVFEFRNRNRRNRISVKDASGHWWACLPPSTPVDYDNVEPGESATAPGVSDQKILAKLKELPIDLGRLFGEVELASYLVFVK